MESTPCEVSIVTISAARLAWLERVADLAERLTTEAWPLQEQFNPETFEVPADIIDRLTLAFNELWESESTLCQ